MPSQPNILLITTDQQRFDTIQATGNPCIRTPHLNWLCDQGIRFTRAYTDAPVCGPARYTIMTGRHACNQQVNFNCWNPTPIDHRRTLPGLLTQHGYQTRAIGKMHFIPERNHLGFEHMELLADYYRYMERHPQLGRPMDHGLGQNEMEPTISTVAESHSLTRWTVERSVDFLETRDAERPFFLWTSFSKPHPPFDPCLSYWQMYAQATMPEPVYGDWSRQAADIPPGFREPTWILNNIDRWSPDFIRDCRRAYYALITQIDYNLGILFARLRELELLENTVILFTSDHGEMLGDHHLGAKSVFFEGSAHIPLLLRLPGNLPLAARRGIVCEELVCLADILPTCLGFAGVTLPAGHAVDGLDLSRVQRGEQRRERLFGEANQFHCVIEGNYKYHFTSHGGGELLFDLERDPLEQHDLIRSGTQARVCAELREKLTRHLMAYQHPVVKNGTLTATAPAPDPRTTRGDWPGFHSPRSPSEVSH